MADRDVIARWMKAQQGEPVELKVEEVEFASGQEPESRDFAALVRVTFSIEGALLARTLGKQRRVLSRALDKAGPRQLFTAVERRPQILAAIRPHVRRLVGEHMELLGERRPAVMIDWADESDLPYAAFIYPAEQRVRLEMELDVISN